jgi:uncharacterized protein
MTKIPRKRDLEQVRYLLKHFPITAILGPRQCGKTTLAKDIAADHYFDLENPRDLAKLENPQLLFEDLKGLIVIDEVQRKPELFSLLRYLVDSNKRQKYLILGSASVELVKKSSDSLAGRIAYFELGGFDLRDIGSGKWKDLWLKGGLPRSFMSGSAKASSEWRENYITTFLEKDIPQLGITIPSGTLRKFWTILTNYHGQVVNFSEIGRVFGISDTTVRKYMDILSGTFMIRILQPWHPNIPKRMVKNPKIYFRDSGLYHSLLSAERMRDIVSSTKIGYSWEGFALEQATKKINKRAQEVYFWRTHAGAELDLFYKDKGRNYGIEFKYKDAPVLSKSMVSAVSDLALDHLWVIYPGKDTYKIRKDITAMPLKDFMTLFRPCISK